MALLVILFLLGLCCHSFGKALLVIFIIFAICAFLVLRFIGVIVAVIFGIILFAI